MTGGYIGGGGGNGQSPDCQYRPSEVSPTTSSSGGEYSNGALLRPLGGWPPAHGGADRYPPPASQPPAPAPPPSAAPAPDAGGRAGITPRTFTEVGNNLWDEVARCIDEALEGPISDFDHLTSKVTGMLLVRGPGPTPWALVAQPNLLRMRVIEALIVISSMQSERDPQLAEQAHSVYQAVSRRMLVDHTSVHKQLEEMRLECAMLRKDSTRAEVATVPTRKQLERLAPDQLGATAGHLYDLQQQLQQATAYIEQRRAQELPPPLAPAPPQRPPPPAPHPQSHPPAPNAGEQQYPPPPPPPPVPQGGYQPHFEQPPPPGGDYLAPHLHQLGMQ